MNRVKILVIDDDEGIRTVIPRMLEGLGGPQVLTASTLGEAIEIINRIPSPDFIFLDLGLPDTASKEETLNRISEIREINPMAPIMVLTGDTDKKLEQISTLVGVDAYRRKDQLNCQRDLWLGMKEAINVHVEQGFTPTEAMSKIMTAITNLMLEQETERTA